MLQASCIKPVLEGGADLPTIGLGKGWVYRFGILIVVIVI